VKLSTAALYRLAEVLDAGQDLSIGEAAERFAYAETRDPQARPLLAAAAEATLGRVAEVKPYHLPLYDGLVGHLEAEALGWITADWSRLTSLGRAAAEQLLDETS
jgi:hypothetical protein